MRLTIRGLGVCVCAACVLLPIDSLPNLESAAPRRNLWALDLRGGNNGEVLLNRVCDRHTAAAANDTIRHAHGSKIQNVTVPIANPENLDRLETVLTAPASASRVQSGGGSGMMSVAVLTKLMYAVAVVGGVYVNARYMATGKLTLPGRASRAGPTADGSGGSSSTVPHTPFVQGLWESALSGLHYIYMTYH